MPLEDKNTCESYEPWKLSHSKTRFNKRLEDAPSAWFLSAYQKTFGTVQPKQKPEAELKHTGYLRSNII